MKEIINVKLKNSLESERENVRRKSTHNIDDRFEKADNLFIKEFKPEYEKINVIRDTFTLPEKDYDLIGYCKNKLLQNKISTTKSEIIRAGLIILSGLTNNELINAINHVEKIKTGRPKNNS
jgi:hypothetical protein